MPVNFDQYRAIVRLTCTSRICQSLGSGVLFSKSGLVITNNHVIEDADFGTAFGEIAVESLSTVDRPPLDSSPAEVVIRNEELDLAVVQILGTPPEHFVDILGAPKADVSLMERRIRVLGYPPKGGGTITVTRGIVSGFDELGNLKTDAEVNPGNSGGAALDDLDNFLGLPSFIFADAQGKLGFIIPADRVKQWFGAVMKSGLPASTEQLAQAFADSNLIFSDGNLDCSTKYPRILGKFAAVELLLAKGEYDKALPQLDFILEKRPRSALAYHYRGNAFLGLRRYIDAAAEFRTALAYNSSHIPALGNLGVTLVHLSRHGEALQLFEAILDQTDNAAELWTAYNNIAGIYEHWKKGDLTRMYREKANGMRAAADECLSHYKHHPDPQDKIAAIANAIVFAEIKTQE